VLVQRVTTRLGADPKVGNIIVFHPPAGADGIPAQCGAPSRDGQPCAKPTQNRSDQTFIKRVVAVGGDTVAVRNGLAIVNGRTQPAPFAAACAGGDGCNMTQPITVPKGSLFLMGDNRGNSDDSRYWGPVPDDWVIGKAFATYWPPSRIGIR
jgi:signal peptidase I